MSKQGSDRNVSHIPSLAEPKLRTQNSNVSKHDEALGLSEVSPKDAPWDKHRAESDLVKGHYEGTKFQSYADRISNCANLLDFRLVPSDGESYKLRLSSAYFCHARHCVVCQWRRSLRIKARAFRALPGILKDYPTARFLFLTLTVKNCEITKLRETLTHMNKSWQRFSQLKKFPAIGYLRTTEVTRGRDNISAHPHFHALLMVRASFFTTGYIKQRDWVAMWQKSLRVDYKPILDVQALKKGASVTPLLAEICKYSTKPSTVCYVPSKEWFVELTEQLHRTKAMALGGVFKEYFRDLDKEVTTEEMIHTDNEPDCEVDEGHLRFGWRYWEKRYRHLE